MAKLYELAGEYLSLMQRIEEGDITPEDAANLLVEVQDNFEWKALNTGRLIKNLNSELAELEKERKRLQAREASLSNHIEGLKGYVKVNMEQMGMTRVKDPIVHIYLQKTGGSVEVTDESAVLSGYWLPQPDKLDRQSILEQLKAKVDVPGCRLKTGTTVMVR